MQHPITHRQIQVLATIRASLDARGYAPTLRELCVLLGVASANTVTEHLQALERKGYLRRDPRVARALVLTPRGARTHGPPGHHHEGCSVKTLRRLRAILRVVRAFAGHRS